MDFIDKIGWMGLPIKTWLIIAIPFILSSVAPFLVGEYLIKSGKADGHE